MPKQVTSTFRKLKDHKHVVRFNAVKSADAEGKSVDNPVRDIYVEREFSNGLTEIEVTFKG
jgi:hypothetical protein